MSNRKGQVELAKERLVKAVNQVLGIVRRNGRSRKVGLALYLFPNSFLLLLPHSNSPLEAFP